MPSLLPLRHLLAAVSAAVLVACGGQQFVAGSGDGGSSGSSGSSSGVSSSGSSGSSSGTSSGSEGGACVTEPVDAGDEATFCALETELFTRCGECEACRQSDLNDCAALGDSLSTAFKSALGSCESQVLCGDYSTYGTNPCVAAALTNSTKSSAQISAATTYCSKCAVTSGLSACVTDYFQPPQPDGGSAGVGYIVLLGNDTTAAAVQSACTPGLTCPAAATYELCAVGQFCKAEPTEACSAGGYCK
jgi:hypothetical protein